MKKTISLIISLLLLNLQSPLLFAAESTTVQGIDVAPDSVQVKLDKPAQYDTFVTADPPRIVLELFNTKLKAADAKKTESTGKFLKSITAEQYQSSPLQVARVVLQLAEKAAYDVISVGNTVSVMLKPSSDSAQTAAKPAAEKPAAVPAKTPAAADMRSARAIRQTGQYVDILENLPRDPITLDYDSTDIKDVLDMMASKIGINMVYSDDVSGDVSLHLTKVPFAEAFSTVLSIRGLIAQQLGNSVLRIASAQTIKAERTDSPLVTRVFQLKYLKASEALAIVESIMKSEGRTGGGVVADTVNNVLVITDISSGQDGIARVLNMLDKKPVQVLIETKIVEVNLKNAFSFGINWAAYGSGASGGGTNFFGTGNIENQSTSGLGTTSGVVPAYDGSKTIYTPMPTSGSGGFGVSFPEIDGDVTVGSFRFGRITDNLFLDMTISAAEQKGKAKVLSDPKVATLNNKEAKINITTQIPYVTTETTNSTPPIINTIVKYIETGITLQVTPQVNDDGRITLKIKPTVSQKSTTITPATGGAPGVDTRGVETNVMTMDGETIVIGGLIYDSVSDTVYKVPLLGDIPILGWLFKKKANSRQRIELLIFVTPRIVNG